jgi:hypothetical protein
MVAAGGLALASFSGGASAGASSGLTAFCHDIDSQGPIGLVGVLNAPTGPTVVESRGAMRRDATLLTKLAADVPNGRTRSALTYVSSEVSKMAHGKTWSTQTRSKIRADLVGVLAYDNAHCTIFGDAS